MNASKLVNEVYTEVMHELELGMQPDDGDATTQLAQAKGELASVLDRAAREGIIKKGGPKIKILKINEYKQRIGDLPRKIKELQQQLEPGT